MTVYHLYVTQYVRLLVTQVGEEVRAEMAPDRRAGKGIPHVGKQPRDRNNDGSWRKKRSDAGKPRKKGK